MKDFIPFTSSYAHSFTAHICISFTSITHVILVLVVLPKFWNPLLSLIPFWRATLTLVLKCYVQLVVISSTVSMVLGINLFFIGEMYPNGETFFENAKCGPRTHLLITKISSIWANFHRFMMIPSKILMKVLHFLFHWCRLFDKWRITEKKPAGNSHMVDCTTWQRIHGV
jgi:hypothetical protein